MITTSTKPHTDSSSMLFIKQQIEQMKKKTLNKSSLSSSTTFLIEKMK